MVTEFKYSVWALALKLIGVYVGVVILNLLVLSGLLGIFEDSTAWTWFVQVLAFLINFGLVFMFASSDGRRDILVDSANEKRALRHEEYKYAKIFDEKKGFLAGLFAQVPIVVLFIVWLIGGSPENGVEIIIRVFFSPYFQLLALLQLNVLSVLILVAIFTAIAGLANLSAKSHHKKVLTIIKRNEEKAHIKGIVRKKNK